MRRLQQSFGRGSFGSAGYKLIFGSQAEGLPQGAYRRTETPIEFTKQYDSAASNEDNSDTIFADGPPWSRLLDIIGVLGITIAVETELVESSSNGTDQLWAKEGTFGTVTLVRWTPLEQSPGKQVAIKRFAIHTVEMLQRVDRKQAYHRLIQDIMFEIEIMGRLKHCNVVGLEAVLFLETSEGLICPALLMEAADTTCPDLEAFLRFEGVMNRTMTSALASGIADGLNALHLLGVVHADLKPTNVLMYRENNKWVPKVADFGLSGISVSSDAPRGGTHRWNAPECLPDAPDELRALLLRPARDIYAFGLIYVYLLLGGLELFSQYNGDIDAVKLNTSDVVADYAWSLVEEKSPDLADEFSRKIILSTLRLDPAKRWNGLGHVSRYLSLSEERQTRRLGFARFLRCNPWSIAREQDDIKGEFLPFGGISITREYRASEIAASFYLVNFQSLFRSAVGIPAVMRRALMEQFWGMALKHTLPLSEIPIGLCLMVLPALSKAQFAELQLKRPDIARFKDSLVANPIKAMGEHINFWSNIFHVREVIAAAFSSHGLKLMGGLDGQKTWEVANVHLAAFSGDYTTLEAEIALGNAKLSDNAVSWTPLHSAILAGDYHATEILLASGADPNACLSSATPATMMPLCLAVMLGKIPIIQLLLKDGDADVWSREYGWWSFTVAHLAVEFCEGDRALQLLLSHEPLLAHSRDVRGRTPLHRAALAKNFDCVCLLLRYGAEVDAKDIASNTPLHRAYASGNNVQGMQEVMAFDTTNQVFPGREQLQVNLKDMFDELPQDSPLQHLLVRLFLPVLWISLNQLTKVWERVIDECPADHDPFILIKRHQVLRKESLLNVVLQRGYSLLKTIRKSHPRTYNEGDCQKSNQQLESMLSSFISPESTVNHLEFNLREAYKNTTLVLADVRSPGQKGTTFVADSQSRMIIYHLLRQGADPEAENVHGYTPECFAYRPSDMMWKKFRFKAQMARNCYPKSAFTVVPLRYPLGNDSCSEIPSLHIKLFRGVLEMWDWIPDVLPCPNGVCLAIVGGRLPVPPNGIGPPDFAVTVEVKMLPPNDSVTKTRILSTRKLMIRDLFPKEGRLFHTVLGCFRIKHKCRLFVSIQSDASNRGMIGDFVLAGMQLDGSSGIPPEFADATPPTIVDGVNDLGLLQTSRVWSQIIEKDEIPHLSTRLLKTRKCWQKLTGKWQIPIPGLGLVLALVERYFFRELFTLKIANPNLYTRLRIQTPDGTKHGPKTWHYDRRKEPLSEKHIRAVSDNPGPSRVPVTYASLSSDYIEPPPSYFRRYLDFFHSVGEGGLTLNICIAMITLYYGITSISTIIKLVSLYRTNSIEAYYQAKAKKLMIEAAEATPFELGMRFFSFTLGCSTLLGMLYFSIVGL